MKVECVKESLVNTISTAEKISGKNHTQSILSCKLLTTKGKNLSIRSTNLELGIEITLTVKVIKEGTVAVSGSVLYNSISTIQGDVVELELIGGNLSVKNNTGKTLIKTHNNNDFPTIPKVKGDVSLKLKKEGFLQGIQSVWYSASPSTIKPELSSLYIYYKDGNMVFVATDSFRLAEKTVIVGSIKEFNPILIPIKNIPEIIRVLEQSDDTFEITLSNNQIAFVFGNIYLTSRIIDGTFPDYKQIIPKITTTEVIALKQDFLLTLKHTTIFLDRFNQVGFNINKTKKQLFLSSKNSDIGETNTSLSTTITGDDLDINFNLKYVFDCFQSIHSDNISLSFSGLSKPLIIRGVSDNSFLYLVMPMNK